jgi:hypothetical protein
MVQNCLTAVAFRWSNTAYRNASINGIQGRQVDET